MSKITNKLYLGNWFDAQNLTMLKRFKVSHILCCSAELRPMFPNYFKYKHIRANDHPAFNLAVHLDDAADFIHEGLSKGSGVFVHCYAGVSRSTTCMIAYFMKYKEMTFLNALRFIRSKRSIVNPNPGFVTQLRSYAKRLMRNRQREANSNIMKKELDNGGGGGVKGFRDSDLYQSTVQKMKMAGFGDGRGGPFMGNFDGFGGLQGQAVGLGGGNGGARDAGRPGNGQNLKNKNLFKVGKKRGSRGPGNSHGQKRSERGDLGTGNSEIGQNGIFQSMIQTERGTRSSAIPNGNAALAGYPGQMKGGGIGPGTSFLENLSKQKKYQTQPQKGKNGHKSGKERSNTTKNGKNGTKRTKKSRQKTQSSKIKKTQKSPKTGLEIRGIQSQNPGELHHRPNNHPNGQKKQRTVSENRKSTNPRNPQKLKKTDPKLLKRNMPIIAHPLKPTMNKYFGPGKKGSDLHRRYKMLDANGFLGFGALGGGKGGARNRGRSLNNGFGVGRKAGMRGAFYNQGSNRNLFRTHFLG